MWKPLSSDRSVCSDHGDEVEKVTSFLLQSVEIVFQLFDPYDRWAFFSAIVRMTVIVGIVAFIWKLGFTLTQN